MWCHIQILFDFDRAYDSAFALGILVDLHAAGGIVREEEGVEERYHESNVWLVKEAHCCSKPILTVRFEA